MKGRWIFLAAFAFVFYGNGAAFVESFVNYSSWHLIGSDEFIQFHRFIGPRVLAFLVAPALIGTLLTILMLWFRPEPFQCGCLGGLRAAGHQLGVHGDHTVANSIRT